MTPIYLDYNATTPIDPSVFDAMLPYLHPAGSSGGESEGGIFGNPSSSHEFGKAAREAVERARRQVAELIGALPEEIVFTGGGSEASNQAIKGVAFQRLLGGSAAGCVLEGLRPRWIDRLTGLFRRRQCVHVITTAIEHPATLRPCEFLQRLGCRVTVLPVDRQGVVDLSALERALRTPAALVSIMHANNEVGTIQPIRAAAELAHSRGALVHADAAQSLGKVAVDVNELAVDLLTVAGHKLYAPKGVGALYVRSGVLLEPLIHGAGHEAGRRAGTENVAGVVALGAACTEARRRLPQETRRLQTLRDRLWDRLRTGLGNRLSRNGHPEFCLPNTLNVNVAGWTGAELLETVPGLAASTGSACHEGKVSLSPVLQAMGVPAEVGRGAIRLSVGRFTTEEEVDRAAELLCAAACREHALV